MALVAARTAPLDTRATRRARRSRLLTFMGKAVLGPRVPDAPYERQLLVCTYGPWCRLDGSDEVRAALKDGVKAAGIAQDLRVTKSGCLGQCGHGPMLALWPHNEWYAGVRVTDVPDLLAHLQGGPPVERLRYRPANAGSNKTPDVLAKEKKED